MSFIVLIIGELGMGKEFLVWVVYNFSKCREWLLVKVNCVNLLVNIIESELFGYECGVFIGVYSCKVGWFELVNKGMIFLDEVGEFLVEL